MRRVVAPLAVVAALFVVASASAQFQPIRRQHGEATLPRVRAGTISVPTAQRQGRVTVIVTLADPPLAAYARTLSGRSSVRRLDVGSHASRAYAARLARAQTAAVASLKRAIPEATVSRRFTVLLNGITVSVPPKRLPAVARLSFARRVYPSLRYSLALNRSPGLIGADAVHAAGGTAGRGVKIAVVDDGIDPKNPFFDPAGFEYPLGFPKGGSKWTSPKVIVARAFVGAGADDRSRLALDPQASFHGTHVAGIAAGNAGTTASQGRDHPATGGLSGVAPLAWVGNYRVFNVPTPIGHVANTPEIIAAFESAVRDGMDVINFSGGGPQTDPVTDAMVETVRNVSAAGVVPVISAGNDRDQYGLGSAGSPGTAPDAISVAALSNAHVFAPALRITAPDAPESLRRVPFVGTVPAGWNDTDRALVDVTTIVGTDGKPVGDRLCGPPGNPNGGPNQLPPGSLLGAVALVSRGECTFVSKSARVRAAGAVGLVLVDNRPGEANGIPIQLPIPAGMVSDADGRVLRGFLAAKGGRAEVRIGRDAAELTTGRSGIVTSFSSAGLTAFGHQLKPDVGAPGGQILSATLPRAGGPFAVFDGTSMAAPHVAGLAALLVEHHRAWTPGQIKSALVSTAGPAWADTARTIEAPVTLAGGGLANVAEADAPRLFTDPVSLSFGDLNVNHGQALRSQLVRLSDAGDGGGTWTVEVAAQAQHANVAVEVQSAVSVAPGGDAVVPVSVRARGDATAGEGYGFLLLRRGELVRKIPYAYLVTRPALEAAPVVPLRFLQTGDTRNGVSRASAYRYPNAAFGPAPDYVGPPVNEDGAETLYRILLDEPVANFGAAVISASPGSLIHPWVLGSPDENDVQGYAGTPVNVNNLTLDYPLDIGAAAAVFPRQGHYYVSVDSGRDPFTGRSLAGEYLLRAWVNDVSPPLVGLMTTRVSAGRPTIALRIDDRGAGIDPYSLAIGYGRTLVGASAYDPISAIALFALPAQAPALKAGKRRLSALASDFQEAKNVDSVGDVLMPNTTVAAGPLRVVAGPTITWLAPERRDCVAASTPLAVLAGSPAKVRSVRFLDGRRPIATDKAGPAGLFVATWKTKGAAKGEHQLRAIVTDAKGRKAEARRLVRVCPPPKPG